MPPRPIVRKFINQKEATSNTKSQSKLAANKTKTNDSANQILKNRQSLILPKSDISQDIGIQRSIPSVYSSGDYGRIEELAPFENVPEDQYNEVLKQKLAQCRIICNFTDPMADLKNKSLKQNYLQEISDHISQPRYYKYFDSEAIQMLFLMVKANLIRSLPPIPDLAKAPMLGDDINDNIYESAWPHLELVYQIFLHFLESTLLDPAAHESYIDSSFISKFIMLFNASDMRERDSLKMVFHRIYLKFVSKRPLLRQAIQHVLYTYIYETKYFAGITELLEIMISIVNGYAVPLKQEHKDFLIRILLPLYTSNFLHTIHANLFFCVQQYIKKDANLIPVVVKELLKIWPVTNSYKELFFISDLSKIFESMSDEQFKELIEDLFQRIGLCLTSYNFQVSESSMLLWKNDKFVRSIQANAEELYPIICPFLYKTGTNHWNPAIKNLAVSVIRICMEMSRNIFEAYSKGMKAQAQQKQQQNSAKKEKWLVVLSSAKFNDAQLQSYDITGDLDRQFVSITD